MITVDRDGDDEVMYFHEFVIIGDGIKDCNNPDDINFAYDDAFLDRFKVEIDKIVSGEWFDQSGVDAVS